MPGGIGCGILVAAGTAVRPILHLQHTSRIPTDRGMRHFMDMRNDTPGTNR